MSFHSTCLLIAVCVALSLQGCAGQASNDTAYPTRPIKLVVPFNAGGSSDTFARVMQKAIAEHGLLPEPLVIVNRGGAGGTIGSRYVKHRRPDGYTIMLLHDAVLTARYAGKVEYGPEAFEPIVGTGEASEVIVVGELSRFESLEALVDEAQQQPNSIKFAVNLGAPSHFTAQELESAAAPAKFRYVQSGGGADRFAALAGRHVDATIFSVGEYLQFQSAGLRALAVFDPERNTAIPEVPTAREAGVDVVSSNMQFWWAPKGTPPERIRMLADAITKAMATEEVRTALASDQIKPIVLDADQVRQRLAEAEQQLSIQVAPPVEYLAWFPHLVALACLVLAVTVGIQQKRIRSSSDSNDVKSVSPASPSDARRSGTRNAVLFALLSICYAVAFGSEWIDFRVATMIFVAVAGWLLSASRWKSLLPIAAIALMVCLGTHFVFVYWLGVDLP